MPQRNVANFTKTIYISQHSGDLKSELVWMLNGRKEVVFANGPDFKWDLK